MEIDILYIIVVISVILVSMTLHEVMHGFVAYLLGDDTAKAQGRLTLNPIRHIDPFLTIILPVFLAIVGAPVFGGARPVPFNPARVKYDEWGAALVAIAGPLTNLLIAFIVFGIGVVSGVVTTAGVEASFIGLLVQTTVMVNLGFFIFNIIPFPPLDGSRVLYALAPDFVRRGMEVIERFGVLFVFVIVFFASSSVGVLISAGVSFFIGLFTGIFGL